MTEDEAIEILKIELENTKRANECGLATKGEFDKQIQAIETILDLYQKTKYELEGKECVIDTMAHNEEVLTRNYEILETKLQQEREKNKELEEKQNRLAFKTNQYMNDVLNDNIVSKDKIKEKLEYATKMVKFYTTNEPDHILIPIYNEVIKLCKELLERR